MMRNLFVLLIAVVPVACGDPGDTGGKSLDYQEIKRVAEERKRNFNPAFIADTYAARVFKIENYEIRDSLIRLRNVYVPAMKSVAGELPEQNAKGPFKVTFLTEKNDTVYHFGMESPLYVRREFGADRGLYRVKTGSFLVPMPPLKEATRMILKDSDGTQHESKFRIQ